MAVALPRDLYHAGKLKEAIAATTDLVRKNPGDISARMFLAELLSFAGEWERADKQLDTLSTQDPSFGVTCATFRQLLQAEQVRQKFFSEGRLPEFVEPPNDRLKLLLQASIAVRDGKVSDAAKLLNDADQMRPRLTGTCDEKPFDDFRDLDDLTASIFEVVTIQGKYYWVPMERVETMEFIPHECPRDVLWRRVKVTLRGGVEREVNMPSLYPGSFKESDQQLCLGQGTEWRGEEGQPIRGVGHRMLLIGEDARPFLELGRIHFNAPDSGS